MSTRKCFDSEMSGSLRRIGNHGEMLGSRKAESAHVYDSLIQVQYSIPSLAFTPKSNGCLIFFTSITLSARSMIAGCA